MPAFPLFGVFCHILEIEENKNYVHQKADKLFEELLALQVNEEEWFETKKNEWRNVQKFADWQKKDNKRDCWETEHTSPLEKKFFRPKVKSKLTVFKIYLVRKIMTAEFLCLHFCATNTYLNHETLNKKWSSNRTFVLTPDPPTSVKNSEWFSKSSFLGLEPRNKDYNL